MEARQVYPDDEADDELERVIARIRGRGPGLMGPPPSADAVAAILARFGDEEPMTADVLAEHERMWRAVDAATEAMDRDADGGESV